MQIIPLDPIPNQSLTLQLDNNLYDLTFRLTNNVMSAIVVRNGETIVSNMRVIAGIPLLPFDYLEAGNFIFLTDDEELPYYTQFGITQTLLYASQAEIDAL